MIDLTQNKERALAVAVNLKGSNRELAQEYLDELSFLAETAGAEVLDTYYQELEKKKRATLIGKGKVQEIKEKIIEEKIQIVIFDDDLSPMQVRNLEKEFDTKVVDRSGLILDIFAKRAKSNEAKTQVELAQLQYLLPRLSKMWTHFSKQFGGIGTKGPGETQIESDRRLIKDKIIYLKNRLEKIDLQNEQKRKNRENLVKFGLVGYTNSGKSTLMKCLTNADVYIQDELFATLDTTVRAFELPNGVHAMLSDTVGFIRKLPAHLVASFRSTLAEAKESDYLLNVVDITHHNFEDHIKVVNETLEKLKINIDNIIIVFNKVDLLEDFDRLKSIQEQYPDSVFISAKTGLNIPNLLNFLQIKYDQDSNISNVMIKYSETNKLPALYKLAEIIEQIDNDFGSQYKVRVKKENILHFNNLFKSCLV
ncbi:MAG: GTPase HflX [Candidatus Kapabacteria bacterium]|nr:GTPase HflX [Candidatus Kapabacteria bacterium]